MAGKDSAQFDRLHTGPQGPRLTLNELDRDGMRFAMFGEHGMLGLALSVP